MCVSLLLHAGAQFSSAYFGAKFVVEAPTVYGKIFSMVAAVASTAGWAHFFANNFTQDELEQQFDAQLGAAEEGRSLLERCTQLRDSTCEYLKFISVPALGGIAGFFLGVASTRFPLR